MTDVQVDMSNIKSLVILLCVVGLGVYVFLELRKIKSTIATLETQVQANIRNIQRVPPPRPMNVTPDEPVLQAVPPQISRSERVSVVKQANTVPPKQKEPVPKVPETTSSRTIPISSATVESDGIHKSESESSDEYESEGGEAHKDPSPMKEQEQVRESELFMDAPEPAPNEPSAGMSLNITELDRLMMDADISPETDPVVPDIVEAEIPDISSLSGPPTDSQPQDIQKDKYKDKTVSELKAILEEKGLQTSGNKTKMIERIVSSESTP